ncbi:MAG TPA: hypothetical protein VK807_23290 [Gemmatimonadaceae bacterium]|nr:hypothetical protein [Gemmatimonadaceae bacterium]
MKAAFPQLLQKALAQTGNLSQEMPPFLLASLPRLTTTLRSLPDEAVVAAALVFQTVGRDLERVCIDALEANGFAADSVAGA